MTLAGIIFGYLQRYETIALFESFSSLKAQNYQHLLITPKSLKSIINTLKIDLITFLNFQKSDELQNVFRRCYLNFR